MDGVRQQVNAVNKIIRKIDRALVPERLISQYKDMSLTASVDIHPSQFPERVRSELLDCLRSRRVHHKFHYDSVKQTMQWLALHQACSPSRTDADCAAIYDRCFAEVIARIPQREAHLIGLGCGGGQKDARLIKGLRDKNCEVFYTPLDVSTAMVLVARTAALEMIPPSRCFPFVCDLAVADDIREQFERPFVKAKSESRSEPGSARLFTFFGMIPNFEPQVILPKLAKLIDPHDLLLFSANLAPGRDYAAGVQRILPLYDNALTRDWLMMFLVDLGIEPGDGNVRFSIEDEGALKRIVARFEFTGSREIQVDDERFRFSPGDSIRLFFSYRHTPTLVRSQLAEYGMHVLEQWVAPSEEEGVFLVARA
jgi:uncharacterized SAM-dependent methyltransferase